MRCFLTIFSVHAFTHYRKQCKGRKGVHAFTCSFLCNDINSKSIKSGHVSDSLALDMTEKLILQQPLFSIKTAAAWHRFTSVPGEPIEQNFSILR